MLKLIADIGEYFTADRELVAIEAEEPDHLLGLLKRLKQSIQQDPVETPIAGPDAMLMMLAEGVHRDLQCGEIPEDTPANAFPALCLPTVSPHVRFEILPSGVGPTILCSRFIPSQQAFPRQETYGLALQRRRAAVSIPANIAEGFRRRGKADKARFMNMAEGSVEECRYFLILASDLGYGDTSSLSALRDEVSRMLSAYASAILTCDF